METSPEDLSGLSSAQAHEYIVGHLATLKLTEKQIAELETSVASWQRRVELARGALRADLEAAASAELERVSARRDGLAAEAASLRASIDRMKSQLGSLGSKERSIDPDLLEQELLMATGRNPGEEASAGAERKLQQLEKDSAAEAELSALKARLAGETDTQEASR